MTPKTGLTCLLLGLMLLVLPACVQAPFIVEQGSELATVVALQRAEATAEEAQSVGEIALTVEQLVDGDAIDAGAIKARILALINDKFEDKQDRLIMTLLVDDIADLIVEYLNQRSPTTPVESHVVVLVRAAAKGVQDGAKLYEMTLGGTAVLAGPVAVNDEDEAYYAIEVTGSS